MKTADALPATDGRLSRRVRVDTDLAALQRASYGRSWVEASCGADRLQVDFQQADARHAELQCQLRCAGLTFEVQFVEPAALLDLATVLRADVPAFVQLAAVMHAAEDLLRGLEVSLGARIELVALSGPAPAWEPHTALGLRVSRLPAQPCAAAAEAGAARPAGSAVLLRALDREGWQRLRQATRDLPLSPGGPDPRIEAALCLDPIPLTLAELRDLAAGDVLLLQAAATAPGQPRRVDVTLRVGGVRLAGVRATRTGTQLFIAQPACPSDPPADLIPASPAMTFPDTVRTPPEAISPAAAVPAATLEAIELDIELELGSLRLPLSALRALAVGQVHELGTALDGETVVLRCGGQRLGLGRLVDVGERLGVRIVALGPHTDATAAFDPSSPL